MCEGTHWGEIKQIFYSQCHCGVISVLFFLFCFPFFWCAFPCWRNWKYPGSVLVNNKNIFLQTNVCWFCVVVYFFLDCLFLFICLFVCFVLFLFVVLLLFGFVGFSVFLFCFVPQFFYLWLLKSEVVTIRNVVETIHHIVLQLVQSKDKEAKEEFMSSSDKSLTAVSRLLLLVTGSFQGIRSYWHQKNNIF